MSDPPNQPNLEAPPLGVVIETVGHLVDAEAADQSSGPVCFAGRTRIADTARSQLGDLEVVRDAVIREQYIVGARLVLPDQRQVRRWAYEHYFMPGSDVARDDHFLRGDGARQHLQRRLESCPVPWLRSRYADLLHMTATENQRESARRATTELLAASSALASDGSRYAFLVRALELVLTFHLDERLAELQATLREDLERDLSRVGALDAIAALRAVAEIDQDRRVLDYEELADITEQAARDTSIQARNSSELPRGPIHGTALVAARCTRDTDRQSRCRRANAEHLLWMAERHYDDGDPNHGQHWLEEARVAAQNDPSLADLREQIGRTLQRRTPELARTLERVTAREELSEEARSQLEQVRQTILDDDFWPAPAAYALVLELPPARVFEAEQASPIQSLFAHRRIEDGRTIGSTATDWRHRASRYLDCYLRAIVWPHVFREVLPQLIDRGLVIPEVLIAPFVGRLEDGDIDVIEAASVILARGEFVASSQLWALIAERTIRWATLAGGSDTTAARGDTQREIPINIAIDRLEQVLSRSLDDEALASRVALLLRYVLEWRGFGMNLRNRVAHGTIGGHLLSSVYVAYVLYLVNVLIVIMLPATEPDGGE